MAAAGHTTKGRHPHGVADGGGGQRGPTANSERLSDDGLGGPWGRQIWAYSKQRPLLEGQPVEDPIVEVGRLSFHEKRSLADAKGLPFLIASHGPWLLLASQPSELEPAYLKGGKGNWRLRHHLRYRHPPTVRLIFKHRLWPKGQWTRPASLLR
jgi:hypothetical protein